jgi:hypothetical protein
MALLFYLLHGAAVFSGTIRSGWIDKEIYIIIACFAHL